ncbi:MAG TPA: amidohydrolase family protein [Thermoanaerobaculia bacterium]|nr:amidohydrolase family protein [Thermoanaerobaculia bacterium]
MPSKTTLTLFAVALLAATTAFAQGGPVRDDLTVPPGLEFVPYFYAYDPPSTLVVPEHPTPRAKYPFVDVHNHQSRMPDQDLGELVADMDALNMQVLVNLSGRGFRRNDGESGHDYIVRALDNVRDNAPGRFVIFTNVSFDGVGSDGWLEETLAGLEADVAAGAAGLKIYKNLGMTATDVDGQRIPTDDPRLDPLWAKCGELGIPVLIHTADPAPFWQPRDEGNERLLELMQRPGRYRDPAEFPSFEELIGEQHAMFRKHPETTFIAAHLGWFGNDLARLGRLLDEMPNVYTEIGAVLAELGRQPRTARQFLIDYQDRVLMGKDSWRPEEYPYYFRTLETADEYFPYYRQRHAFWRLYGLDLPDEVLKKVYYKNALAIVPGIDKSAFPE